MKRERFIAVSFALAVGSSAAANFTGYSSELIGLANGHWIMNVYANFSHANDRVLNVYNTNITTTHVGGFHHSEENPYWKAGNTQNKSTSDDSWVAIGTNPNGSGNAGGGGGVIVADPNFVNFDDTNDSTDFSTIESTGTGAGWYNGAPANNYGYAFDSNRVLLAHLVFDSNQGSMTWQVTMTVFLNGATGSTSGVGWQPWSFPHVPAPGTFGGLLFAGLGVTGRRRR